MGSVIPHLAKPNFMSSTKKNSMLMHIIVALYHVKNYAASYSYTCALQEPLKLDIVISFPDHGFHLRFDPWSQVFFLTMILRYFFKDISLFN